MLLNNKENYNAFNRQQIYGKDRGSSTHRVFFSLILIAQCLENIQSESETKCEIMFVC